MRLIIAGGQALGHEQRIEAHCTSFADVYGPVTTVLCGEAPGADKLGKLWAGRFGMPVESHPANWARDGRRAVPLRNERMALVANSLLLFWDGKSSSSRDMLKRAIKHGLWPIVIVNTREWKA